MNKIKVISRSGRSLMVIKSLKGQQLTERELFVINNNQVRGLLNMSVERRGASFKLIYDISTMITFRQMLTAPLNKEAFVRILDNIRNNLKAMEDAHFNTEMVLMDFDHVMVNPATQTIYFIYVPIQFFNNGVSLRDFLLNIIQNCTFAPGEDDGYVKEYISTLQRSIGFSLFDLEEYVSRLSGVSLTSRPRENRCPNCRMVLKNPGNYCTSCGAPLNVGGTSNKSRNTYDPLAGQSEQSGHAGRTGQTGCGFGRSGWDDEAQDNGRNHLSDTGGWGTWGNVTGGTTVLGEEKNANGTTVLNGGDFAAARPYLIRVRYQQKIIIDRENFRIGANPDNDYVVRDNSAVSGKHAEFFSKDGRYFIKDLHSTNGTIVDGRNIGRGGEMEIYPGTDIRLANEDFTFNI